jgi:hypothetical protein
MITKNVLLSEADAATVKAILMTHAEMQDRRTLEGEEIISRLKVESPDDEDAVDMIADLMQAGNDLTEDSDNLKRIAHLF